MAKAKSYLFKEIRGAAKNTEFRMRYRKIEISKKRVPTNPRSPAQTQQRKLYGSCVEIWVKLDEPKKQQYRLRANKLGISGYNLFMKECITGLVFDYEVTITEQSGKDLQDYQVLLQVSNDPQFIADFGDNGIYMEAYDEDKITPISFYIEEWDKENYNARIWFKIPYIPANGQRKIYLRANNLRAKSLSDPESVFDFFDDFTEDKGYEESGAGSGYYTISNSIITMKETGAGDGFDYRVTIAESVEVKGDGSQIVEAMFEPSVPGEFHNIRLCDEGLTEFSHCYKLYGSQTGCLSADKAYEGEGLQLVYAILDDFACTGKLILEQDDDANKAAESKYDWIRIRKYTSPEPSVTYTKL